MCCNDLGRITPHGTSVAFSTSRRPALKTTQDGLTMSDSTSFDARIPAIVTGIALTIGVLAVWSLPGSWLTALLRFWGMA